MKSSYLKTGLITTENFVDASSGEIVGSNTKHHKFIANSREEFMLLYVSVLPIFIEMSGPAKTVYAYLLSNYDTGSVFEIGGGSRAYIADRLKIANSTVANALTELKEKGLIFSQVKSMYQINPRYAFKGSTSARNEALKAIIEVGCDNC